jgi:hypothetical protein
MKPILVACEESQKVTIALRKNGIEAYSCDLKPTSGNHPEWHLQQDVIPLLKEDWAGIIAFPDCTYLTVSANKWYKNQPKRKSGVLVGQERRNARDEAVSFFMKFVNCSCPNIAIENPIGIMSTVYRKPKSPYGQILQPWMFGHGETKATCLWLKGFPLLKPTNIVEGREQRLHYLPPSKNRAELRSKTFDGIADAMGIQWSSYLKQLYKEK